MGTSRTLFVMLAGILCVVSAAGAFSTTEWMDVVGNWSNADNWTHGEPNGDYAAMVNVGTALITDPCESVHYNLYVGQSDAHNGTPRDNGTILMSSGELYVGYPEYIGYRGTGRFEQSGGEHLTSSVLTLGHYSSGEGTYVLEGGHLWPSSLRVGDEGTGTFTQTGGWMESRGSAWIALNSGSTGTYEMFGGKLTASSLVVAKYGDSGTFAIRSGNTDITLSGAFMLYPNAIFRAVGGSAIKLTGEYSDFYNYKTSEGDVNGLRNLMMDFSGADTGTYGRWQEYEVSAADGGAVIDGYCDNYMLGTLKVSGGATPGKLVLVDKVDNGNRGGGNEALYVRELIVEAGGRLNLGGLKLYCQQADVAGVISGGTLEFVWALDVNGDDIVDFVELSVILAHWLEEPCPCPDRCGGADMSVDQRVDMHDLAICVDNWLFDNSGRFYRQTFDTDPGWTTEGEWAFGTPTGGGGASNGFADPASGATGDNVYGVNLAGDYSVAAMPAYAFLTTETIDCTGRFGVELRFKRWLNVDTFGSTTGVIAIVDAYDGSWLNYAWYNGAGPVTDSGWVDCVYDVSAYADNNPNFRLRWGHWVKAGAQPYSGWNIDDVELWENP